MIFKVEEAFEQLFDTIPTYEIQTGVQSQKLLFSYGEQKALNQLLAARYENNQSSYPLLWYLMPNPNEKVTRQYAYGDFEFVLATNSRPDLYNDQRMKENFAKILYPNLDLVMQAFFGANNFRITENKNDIYSPVKMPNYGTPSEEANKTIDYWDAISFKIGLQIFNRCTKPIVYNTNNLI